jgi:Tfp pilus assembly protein PilF
MLKVDTTLNHIPAGREHVIALFESINQPLVNIPSFGTAPTGAFVLGTRNEYGYYTVFVYLYQNETRAVVIYISEPRNLGPDQYRAEEQEAVRFVESMGFMIDNIYFPSLAASEQEAVMARIPMFRPPDPPRAPPQAFPPPQHPTQRPQAEPQPRFAPPPPPSPFGSDAMFGGLSAQEGDIFRRAGLEMLAAPVGSQPDMRMPDPRAPAGMPLSNQGGTFADGFANAFQDMPRFQAPPPASVPQALPGPASPTYAPQTGAKAPLDRIGRLLGAFALLLAVHSTMACKSGGGLSIEQRLKVESHLDLGNQHLAGRQFSEAIRAFDVVLEMDDGNSHALRGKGLAYQGLGRIEQAEVLYREAIAADPTWSDPKNDLAGVLFVTNRCTEAEGLLRAVLEDIFYQTPDFAEHNLAKVLACQGRAKDALAVLEGITLKRPTFCLGYLTLAPLARRTKRPDMTISACEGFFTNCEQNDEIKVQISTEQVAMCYFEKGMAHVELGDVESARASFTRCQSSDRYGSDCRRSLNMLPP